MRRIVYGIRHFIRNELGELAAGRAEFASSAAAAVRKARLLARQKPGVVAYRQTVDPDTGRHEPPVAIESYGDVPKDLSVF